MKGRRSREVAAPSRQPNVPCSRTSLAARRNAPSAVLKKPEPRLTRRTPAADSSSTLGRAGQREHVDRLRDRRADRADVVDVAQPRRIEHVGARLVEGLQPLDRVVEVAAAVQVVLRARRERERERQGARRPRRRPRCARPPGRADRSARRVPRSSPRSSSRPARPPRHRESSRRRSRVVAEPVLEVAVHGQLGGAGDQGSVLERLVARHRRLAVAAAEAVGEAGARRGERLVAEPGEHAGRADVPRIGHHECARPLVQAAERLSGLCDRHSPSLALLGVARAAGFGTGGQGMTTVQTHREGGRSNAPGRRQEGLQAGPSVRAHQGLPRGAGSIRGHRGGDRRAHRQQGARASRRVEDGVEDLDARIACPRASAADGARARSARRAARATSSTPRRSTRTSRAARA